MEDLQIQIKFYMIFPFKKKMDAERQEEKDRKNIALWQITCQLLPIYK